jgi:hypothetical protein
MTLLYIIAAGLYIIRSIIRLGIYLAVDDTKLP